MALTTNLVSFYEMDEASGNRNDAHNTNHLTDSGSSGRTVGVNGGFSVSMSTGTTFLSRSTNAALETGNISWTMAGWTALNAWTDYYTIIGKYPATENQREYVLYYDFTIDKLDLTVRKGDDTGYTFVESTVVISTSDDGWHFYVVGQNTSTSEIFISVDNETLVTASNPTGMHVGNGAFTVGSNLAGAAANFAGWADQLGFWKRTLTSPERTWLYNAGAGRSYADIIAESAGSAETRTIAMSMVG